MFGRRPAARRSGQHVRRIPVRRSPQPLRAARIVAASLMAVCLVGILAVSVAPAFTARTLEINGATFTSPSIIRSIVGMDGTPNVFRIETDVAEEQLVRLPAVESATVQVKLPSTVVVDVVERVPRLVWVIGDSRYVVDQDGFIFGLVDPAGNPIPSTVGPLATPGPDQGETPSPTAAGSAAPSTTPTATPTTSPTPKPTPTPRKTPTPRATPTKPGAKASSSPAGSATPTINPSLIPSLAPAPTPDLAATSGPDALALPVVFDRRSSDANLGLGGIVDPVDLDAGYRLAGLTPTDVGSKASALTVIVDDVHGFTVSSVPAGWVAEFGFYAPTVRKDTVIPSQVRDLRSMLLYYGESKVAWVRLVADVSSDHVNTYIPR
jgi:POTRA domain, FtsQ-type